LLLTAATAAFMDVGLAVQVLRGVAMLLAVGLVTAADDPSGEVLAASPYGLGVRTMTRVAVAAAVTAPAWLLSATVVAIRAPGTPIAALSLEAAAIALLGVALATALRR